MARLGRGPRGTEGTGPALGPPGRHPGGGTTLRVLWLIDSLTLGGAETLTAAFARFAPCAGLEPIVCCLKSLGGNPVEAEVRRSGVPLVNLEARNLRDAGAFRSLLRLASSARPHLIHSHLTYAGIWGSLTSRLAGPPLVATLHVAPAPATGRRDAVREDLLCLLLRRWGAAVLAVSADLARRWEATGKFPAGRLRVVHNGIEIARFDAAAQREEVRREFGFPASSPLFLTVAVLRPGKGIEVLVEAAAHAARSRPEARFLVVGDGPLRESLERRARQAGLGGVLAWAGRRDDVARLMAAADALLHASLEDAFPTVVLEAMAAGLPVVATRVGGIPEMVRDGTTGLLVAPGGAPALARAAISLLEEPARRRSMGEAGRVRARREFSMEAWIGRLGDVYRGALREGGR